ncbi:hypothetical protein [Nissabacter sp. SGAir0207]|uniref:hypothetical protein n=1 Tax=Nissabacter sp. SGAir0207 TaxID=2126321 RepID=UPI0019812693|nr:hypothetical protein [Nissabacter sp. SGAir0207]
MNIEENFERALSLADRFCPLGMWQKDEMCCVIESGSLPNVLTFSLYKTGASCNDYRRHVVVLPPGEVVTNFRGMVSRLAMSTHKHFSHCHPTPSKPAPAMPELPSRYHREVKGVVIDIYDILEAWSVTCSATQHALKKLMMPGQRGHKDRLKDLREARVSIERAIVMEDARQRVAANPITSGGRKPT